MPQEWVKMRSPANGSWNDIPAGAVKAHQALGWQTEEDAEAADTAERAAPVGETELTTDSSADVGADAQEG